MLIQFAWTKTVLHGVFATLGLASMEGVGDSKSSSPSTRKEPGDGKWKIEHDTTVVRQSSNGGGASISFVDGHVSRFRNVEYWDFKTDRGRTNNPSLVWKP